MEYLVEIFLAQSGLAPENLTTLAHFSVSSAISLPKSAGEPGSTVPPKSASRGFILGSARVALISLLSRSTISADVLFGAPMPKNAPAAAARSWAELPPPGVWRTLVMVCARILNRSCEQSSIYNLLPACETPR